MKIYAYILYFASFLIPFEDELAISLEILKKQTPELIKYSNIFQRDYKILASIVAPEVFRYVKTQDFVETYLNRAFYVKEGGEKYNFSIGIFQMKPKFVEDLEIYVKNNHLCLPIDIAIDRESFRSDGEKIRNIRLNRLCSINWQLVYLCTFSIIMDHKTQSVHMTNDQKVSLYASAYNAGFNKTIEQLQKFSIKKQFPWGAKFKGKQAAYAQLSLIFYHRFSKYLL